MKLVGTCVLLLLDVARAGTNKFGLDFLAKMKKEPGCARARHRPAIAAVWLHGPSAVAAVWLHGLPCWPECPADET